VLPFLICVNQRNLWMAGLIVTDDARGIAILQDLLSLFGALRVGLHEDKLSVMNKRCGIPADNIVRTSYSAPTGP
jgi:hypothetical protein